MQGQGHNRVRELAEALERYTKHEGGEHPYVTAITGLYVLRSDCERRPSHRIFRPALCLVAQGAKWTIVGDRRFEYKAGQALVVSVEMPSLGAISAASPEEPFLGLVIEFDLGVLRDVIAAMDVRADAGAEGEGIFVMELSEPLADCALRMMHLLETPTAIGMLYPGVMRELCYRLLTSPGGGRLARMVMASGHEERVIHALHCLRDRFAEPVRGEELARVAGMTMATFHRQFKAVTSMSPLQYQKQMRLLEARRLMIATPANVESAAFKVGYESASQFSREYRRMFGQSPRRDIEALREQAA